MSSLFAAIAIDHNVAPSEVGKALEQRDLQVDTEIVGAFALLYVLGVSVIVRRLYRSYSSAEGLTATLLILSVVSVLTGAAGVMLGEQWSWYWESHRIGNPHMTYRIMRLPWPHHRAEFFLIGVAIFWLLAAFHRKRRSEIHGPPQRLLFLGDFL
jgi:hypothetical protein